MSDAALASPEPLRDMRKPLLYLFLFIFGTLGILSGGHAYSIDDELMFQGTRSIVNLDGYIDKAFPNDEFYVLRPDGRYSASYGYGQSIIAVPFYVAGRILTLVADDAGADFALRVTTFLTNSFVVAATAVVIAMFCLELGSSRRGSFLLALFYAFGTYAMAHAQTFGSEPGAALCTVLGIYLVVRANRLRSWQLLMLGGLVAGLAASFRISTISFLPLIGLFVAVTGLRRFAWKEQIARLAACAGGMALAVAFLIATNWFRYGTATRIGASAPASTYPTLRGLLNLYFSTGKGLFVFAPICAVIALGSIRYAKQLHPAAFLLAGIIAINSVIVARLPFWSGDYTWGPRYLQVTLPCFVVLGYHLIDRVRWSTALRVAAGIGLVAALLGTFINFNVFIVRAANEVGTASIASEANEAEHIVKIRHDPAWNQILGHLEMLPEAFRDTIGAKRASDSIRYDYVPDPLYHFGYFSAAPRLDFWWLWVGPTDGSRVAFLLLVPLVGSMVVGLLGLRRVRPILSSP